MKKVFVWFLLLALLFTAACGKQPQEPVTPTEPAPPATEAPTEVPTQPVTEAPTQAPTEPATEALTEPATEAPTEPVTEPQKEPEPDGAVTVSVLQDAVPELEGVGRVLPLNGQVSAVLGELDDGWHLLTYDHRAAEVLDKLAVECHDAAGELALLETDPYVFLYQDGRCDWTVTVDGDWQLTREKTDFKVLQSQMGDFTVGTRNNGLTLDEKAIPALQANERISYALIRVLDDHRLLYYATDRSMPGLSHYGVYDHDTGETRAVTTMGQQVIGTWGENLLVGLWADDGWYKLGRIKLEDMSYTELPVDCDTPRQAVSGMELNREGTRILTVRREADGTRMVVYAIPEGDLLYQWTVPTDAEWDFRMVSGQELVFWKTEPDRVTFWTVEY